MNDTLTWIAVTLLLAALVHLAAVKAFPTLLMTVVRRFAGPANVMIHMPPTTAESRAIVRPSPDLLYTGCKYDLGKGPVLIKARLPNTYWSISFFAANTDNFYVVNDRRLAARDVSFLLVRKGRPHPDPGAARLVESPSRRGMFLIRSLVGGAASIDELVAVQKQATIEPA